MALRFWLAGVALLLLGEPGRALPSATKGSPALGSSSHSLHHFTTAISEPNQGFTKYIAVGYVDGQLFFLYDSITRRVQPRAPWMEKMAEKEDPEYWERNTQLEQHNEQVFRRNLAVLKELYNQSGGFHTWQWMCGCELREDGSPGGGHWQYAYDGRDYLSFDTETLTWTAAVPKAEITKEEWEKDPALAQRRKAYLEGECIKGLQIYLQYRKERLPKAEAPVGKVTRTFVSGGKEMLICQAHGFYPKEIEATWRKGREIMEQDTFRRSIAPNSDGTYHTWLSIKINPEDRDLYRCHIDHAGLTEPLVLAWEAPGGHVGAVVGIVVFALLLVAAGTAFFHRCKQQGGPL